MKKTIHADEPSEQRLFIGIYPCTIVFADRFHEDERTNDYKRLASLPYRELVVQFEPDCPADLRAEIEDHAAGIIARRGQRFQIAGNMSITLGE